ncbi:MAG: T9SS type A sorting domain-containing protein [Bacteroidia bacterium]|nr:T9SS type A sorting domain-containing protein [Bacteroidia bacterium]
MAGGESLPLIRDSVTSVEDFIHKRFYMNDCYPNPAAGSTTFSFHINTASHVELKIMDLQGNLVKTLINERKAPGEHRVMLNLHSIRPGVYMYQIKAGILKDTKKLVILN